MAFSGNDGIIRFLDVNTLSLIDSVYIPSRQKNRYFQTIFTSEGILISSDFVLNKVISKKAYLDNKEMVYQDSVYIPVNYLYSNHQLTQYEPLNSYLVYDYSPITNSLLVGYWDQKFTFDQPKVKLISTLNLRTKQPSSQLLNDRIVWNAFYMDNGNITISSTDKGLKSNNIPLMNKLININKSISGHYSFNKINDKKVLIASTDKFVFHDVTNAEADFIYDLSRSGMAKYVSVLSDGSIIYLNNGSISQVK